MSNVNRGVLVSELHWIKFTDTGKWSFYHYCDGVDRVWEHDEDGFVAVAVDHRIDGYCIQGEEDRWKINMLDFVIDRDRSNIEVLQRAVDEMTNLRDNYLSLKRFLGH